MQKLGLVIDSLQIQEVMEPTGCVPSIRRAARGRDGGARPRRRRRRPTTEATRGRAGGGGAEGRGPPQLGGIKRAAYQAEEAGRQAFLAGPLADAKAREQVVREETAVAELEAEREGEAPRHVDPQAGRRRSLREAGPGRGRARGAPASQYTEAQAREVELSHSRQGQQIDGDRGLGGAPSSASPGPPTARPERPRARPRAHGSRPPALAEAESKSSAKRAEARG